MSPLCFVGPYSFSLPTLPRCASARTCASPPRARSPQCMAPGQADDAQFVLHTQHSPLPILHEPANDETSQGADTLVTKDPALQSQVSPHTATVLAAAHTQHSPLPTWQLPVDDRTEHIPLSLLTSVAAPQSQVSPHTAMVRFCVTWTGAADCGCPSSPPRITCANVGTASASTSQVSAHDCR